MFIFAVLPLIPPGPCLFPAEVASRPASIGSMVSETFPLRVHWQETSQQEKAILALEYAELAWQVQVVELGFKEPVLPDSEDGPELDIYMKDVGGWAAWASPDGWVDTVEGDGYASVSAYIVMDSNIDDDWLGVYMVHEFNHVLQWAMDFNEPTWPIFEAVAVAAQDWTLGEAGQWDGEVNTFQEIPSAPAILGDSYVLYDQTGLGYYYEYGASLWVMHLDEVLGSGDGSAGVALWEATSNEGSPNDPDALDAFISVSGGSYGTAMSSLARSRWLTGERWDVRGLPDAESWTAELQVPSTVLSLEPEIVDFVFDPALQITGQGFVEIDLAQYAGNLRVSVDSEQGLQSSLLVLTWALDGTVGEQAISGFYPFLELDSGGLSKIVIAVSNLGPEGFDGDDNPYMDGDQVLQLRYTPIVDDGEIDLGEDDTGGIVADAGMCGCVSLSASPAMGWLALFGCLFARHRKYSTSGVDSKI